MIKVEDIAQLDHMLIDNIERQIDESVCDKHKLNRKYEIASILYDGNNDDLIQVLSTYLLEGGWKCIYYKTIKHVMLPSDQIMIYLSQEPIFANIYLFEEFIKDYNILYNVDRTNIYKTKLDTFENYDFSILQRYDEEMKK